ncbi:MAG: FAD:protein FMN transferase [Paludibacter sp.]|nr:FAD:protein FMN transferase [Paludibacter sp.]MDD4199218.1 FAD:protein FMN transferase [Paludibacter sp.]MDD4428646.1 FAD:protein FMN transferase [Paludibacter sp.]
MKNKVIFSVLLTLVLLSCQHNHQQEQEYIKNSGRIHGTFYHVTYLQPEGKNLQTEIEAKMREFELSLSTFNSNSIISRINNNDDSVIVDEYFETMYHEAVLVSQNTSGAFDITVAPLVNAWGFGFGNQERKKIPDVNSILPYIGYHKIRLENKKLLKSDKRILLDASAIAKGQSSDIIGKLLEAHGCENYMVEIGGEIACKGLNPNGKKWQIGIDRPTEEIFDEQRKLQTILAISNCGLATSGNYRQYYYKDGKKFAHTINPHTGYPVDHNLLSATVIAASSMRADAFATAFMVLGVDSSLAVCRRIPDIECYLIYADKAGNYQVSYSEGFEKYFNE